MARKGDKLIQSYFSSLCVLNIKQPQGCSSQHSSWLAVDLMLLSLRMSGWPDDLSRSPVFVGFRSFVSSFCLLLIMLRCKIEPWVEKQWANQCWLIYFFFFQLDADRDEEEVFCDISMTLDNKLFPSKEPAAGEMKISGSVSVFKSC